MSTRFLINDDGAPFNSTELAALRDDLDALDDEERKHFRDQNALAIAQHDCGKILVVSGPGTGKSHMFLDRIIFWQDKNDDARVLVTSFVRKLVADLRHDIDEKLTEKQQRRITVSTLHKVARSIVERNHGTKKWPFKPYFGIIGPSWKKIVWSDVLEFFPDLERGAYTWEDFEQQLHPRPTP